MKTIKGVTSVAALRRQGITEAEIRWAVNTGALARIRPGWLRTADADPAIVRAVQSGGRLGCVSAAEHHGLWVPEHNGFHVSIPRHAGRHATAGLVPHWAGDPWRVNPLPVEPLERVIRQVLVCCDRDSAISVIDSALYRKKIGIRALERIVGRMPEEYRTVLTEANGLSESGYESTCRLRLSRRGFSLRTQVKLPRIGRVDLLLGDRLIIEADGREWHEGPDAFLVDRSRDLAAHREGYLPLRLAPHHIENEWAWVERVVSSIVERGEHLWSAQQLRYRANNGFGG